MEQQDDRNCKQVATADVPDDTVKEKLLSTCEVRDLIAEHDKTVKKTENAQDEPLHTEPAAFEPESATLSSLDISCNISENIKEAKDNEEDKNLNSNLAIVKKDGDKKVLDQVENAIENDVVANKVVEVQKEENGIAAVEDDGSSEKKKIVKKKKVRSSLSNPRKRTKSQRASLPLSNTHDSNFVQRSDKNNHDASLNDSVPFCSLLDDTPNKDYEVKYESSTLKDKSKVGIKIRLGGAGSQKVKRNLSLPGNTGMSKSKGICESDTKVGESDSKDLQNDTKVLQNGLDTSIPNGSLEMKKGKRSYKKKAHSMGSVDNTRMESSQMETTLSPSDLNNKPRKVRARKGFLEKGQHVPENSTVTPSTKETDAEDTTDVKKGKKARKSMKRHSKESPGDASQKSILNYFKGNSPENVTVGDSILKKTSDDSTPLIKETASVKPPRARKSFNPRSLNPKPEANPPIASINLAPFAPLTIKVTELENVLGIQHKSLEKMDAKTLDRLVLQKSKANKVGDTPEKKQTSEQCSSQTTKISPKTSNVLPNDHLEKPGSYLTNNPSNLEANETESINVKCETSLPEDTQSVTQDSTDCRSETSFSAKKKKRKSGSYRLPGERKWKPGAKKAVKVVKAQIRKRSKSQDSFTSLASVDSSISTRSALANLSQDRGESIAVDIQRQRADSESMLDHKLENHGKSCIQNVNKVGNTNENNSNCAQDKRVEQNVVDIQGFASKSQCSVTDSDSTATQVDGKPILMKLFTELTPGTAGEQSMQGSRHRLKKKKKRRGASWSQGHIRRPSKAVIAAKLKNRKLKTQIQDTFPQLKAMFHGEQGEKSESQGAGQTRDNNLSLENQSRRSDRKRKATYEDFVLDSDATANTLDCDKATLGIKVVRKPKSIRKRVKKKNSPVVQATKRAKFHSPRSPEIPAPLAELAHDALSPQEKEALPDKDTPKSVKKRTELEAQIESLENSSLPETMSSSESTDFETNNVRKTKSTKYGCSNMISNAARTYRERMQIGHKRKEKKVSATSSVPSGDQVHLKFVITPNGMMYPVTPPSTPEIRASPADEIGAEVSDTVRAKDDPLPLCCCRLNGISVPNQFKGTICQALDSVDGRVVGCCNKAAGNQLFRPSVRVPFMAMCELHRSRLKLHQSCPGCGHFCTKGNFVQCKGENATNAAHYYHRSCQNLKDNKYHCPHCALESTQRESPVKYNYALVTSLSGSTEKRGLSDNARMGSMLTVESEEQRSRRSPSPGPTVTVRGKTISADKLPLGPSRIQLQAAIQLMEAEEKPKRLKIGSKSLYSACKQGDLEKAIFLLAENADPNHKYSDHENETPLHAAAQSGCFPLCYFLLQTGAYAHCIDNQLRTPLMEAAEAGYTEIVNLLFRAGAVAEFKADDGMSALHLAAQSGRTETVQFLVEEAKVNINAKDDGGWSAMVWAAEHRHLEVVKYLLAAGADPNMRDNEENTGLHWAAYAGSVDIAEMLLNAGCELEAANEHGDRPLHIAARQDSYKCVALFLARGADCETRNNINDTPIACCADQTSPTWMALKVNRQLKSIAADKHCKPERLVHRDISFGKEANPIPVVNGCDGETYPQDFLYVTAHVETAPMNVNTVITSLQSCLCKDNCSSVFCACSRSSVRCWYTKEGRLVDDFNYSDPPLVFECNKACRCWSNCVNRVVQLGITCRLQVFRTEGRGWGARTLLPIKKGSYVCEYIGELISDADADSREDDSYLFDLDNKVEDTYCIDARQYGNIARFINHLCNPNVIPVKVFMDHQDLRFPRICLFASRDIAAYEELGFDYGDKFWIIKWKQFTCACTSEKCRYNKVTIHKTIEEFNKRMVEDDTEEPFM